MLPDREMPPCFTWFLCNTKYSSVLKCRLKGGKNKPNKNRKKKGSSAGPSCLDCTSAKKGWARWSLQSSPTWFSMILWNEMAQVIWIHLKGMHLKYREETAALSSALSPRKAHRTNLLLISLCQRLVFWREHDGHRCQCYALEVQDESSCQIWLHQFCYWDDTSLSMETEINAG